MEYGGVVPSLPSCSLRSQPRPPEEGRAPPCPAAPRDEPDGPSAAAWQASAPAGEAEHGEATGPRRPPGHRGRGHRASAEQRWDAHAGAHHGSISSTGSWVSPGFLAPPPAASPSPPETPVPESRCTPISVIVPEGPGVFSEGDAEAIKTRVRTTRRKTHQYNVHDRYKADGIFQYIARDSRFENLTLGVISCNAVWIGVDIDWNAAESLTDADVAFIVADVLFFAFFSVELLIRFIAFRRKADCTRDTWFMFDAFLVAMYAFDPFVLTAIIACSGSGALVPTSSARLLRLARLSRLVRMLRALPELLILVKGMLTAISSVSYALGLLLVVTYVCAIGLTQLSSGTRFRDQYFSSVSHSMYSLAIHAVHLDDAAPFADDIKDESTSCFVVCAVYVGVASLTIMNLLIGILVEVIKSVAEKEREDLITAKVHATFYDIVRELDKDSNGMICWDEFKLLVQIPASQSALNSFDVDPGALFEIAQSEFHDKGGELKMTELIDMILNLRGDKQACLRDLMLIHKNFTDKFKTLDALIDSIEGKLVRIAKRKALRR